MKVLLLVCIAMLSQLVSRGICSAQLGEFARPSVGIAPPPLRRELVAVETQVPARTPLVYASSYGRYAPTVGTQLRDELLTSTDTDLQSTNDSTTKNAEVLRPNRSHPTTPPDEEPIPSNGMRNSNTNNLEQREELQTTDDTTTRNSEVVDSNRRHQNLSDEGSISFNGDTEIFQKRTELPDNNDAIMKHSEVLHSNRRHPTPVDEGPSNQMRYSDTDNLKEITQLNSVKNANRQNPNKMYSTDGNRQNHHILNQQYKDVDTNVHDITQDQDEGYRGESNFENGVSSPKRMDTPMDISDERLNDSMCNTRHCNKTIGNDDLEVKVITPLSKTSGQAPHKINKSYNETPRIPIINRHPTRAHDTPADTEREPVIEGRGRKLTPAPFQTDNKDKSSEHDNSRGHRYLIRNSNDNDYDEDDDDKSDDEYDDYDDDTNYNRRLSQDRNVRTRDSQNDNNYQKRPEQVNYHKQRPRQSPGNFPNTRVNVIGERASGRNTLLARPPIERVNNHRSAVSDRQPIISAHKYTPPYDDEEENYYRTLQDWPEGDSRRIIPKTRYVNSDVVNGYRNNEHTPHILQQKATPIASHVGNRAQSPGYLVLQAEPQLVHRSAGSHPGSHRTVIPRSGTKYDTQNINQDSYTSRPNIRVRTAPGIYQGNKEGSKHSVHTENYKENNELNDYLNNQDRISPKIKQDHESQPSRRYRTNDLKPANDNEIRRGEKIYIRTVPNFYRKVTPPRDSDYIDTRNGFNSDNNGRSRSKAEVGRRRNTYGNYVREPDKSPVRTPYAMIQTPEDGSVTHTGRPEEEDYSRGGKNSPAGPQSSDGDNMSESAEEEEDKRAALQSSYVARVAARQGDLSHSQGAGALRGDRRQDRRGLSKQDDKNYRRGESTKGERDTRDWEEYGKRREYHYKLGDKGLDKLLGGFGGLAGPAQGGDQRASRSQLGGLAQRRAASFMDGDRFLQDSANLYVFGWRK